MSQKFFQSLKFDCGCHQVPDTIVFLQFELGLLRRNFFAWYEITTAKHVCLLFATSLYRDS